MKTGLDQIDKIECAFCRSLALFKYLNWQGDLKHEYTVALVEKTWREEHGKRHASRVTDYRNQGLGYKLNYCPECGRKLKRGKS